MFIVKEVQCSEGEILLSTWYSFFNTQVNFGTQQSKKCSCLLYYVTCTNLKIFLPSTYIAGMICSFFILHLYHWMYCFICNKLKSIFPELVQSNGMNGGGGQPKTTTKKIKSADLKNQSDWSPFQTYEIFFFFFF